MRRTVPLAIALIAGTLLLAQYFVPALYDLYEISITWLPVIAGVVAYLGIISFVRHHWIKTKRKTPDWRFSLVSLIAFAVMVVAGFWGDLFGSSVPDVPPTWPEAAIVDTPDDAGGSVNLAWKVEGAAGDIAKFAIRRKPADQGDDAYVTIQEFAAGANGTIGKPHENRTNRGEPYPSILENGDFSAELGNWVPEGAVTVEKSESMGSFAVLADGAALAGPTLSAESGRRYSLTAIARPLDGEPKLTVELNVGAAEPATADVTFDGDDWIRIPELGRYADESGEIRFRFAVTGGRVAIDDVELRPVDMEYWLAYADTAPFNYNEDFPRYGEGDSILTVNPTFDVTLAGWSADEGVERFHRTDREAGSCAKIPAGAALLSAPMDRPDDPTGQRYHYRFRGWGRGGGSPLQVEIVSYDGEGGEIAAEALDFDAESGWERKELMVLPPEATKSFRIRYRATGSEGAAFADDMLFMPVKVDPAPGVAYTYLVEARDAADAVLATASATVTADMEAIGSYQNPVGLFQWLFNYILVPMEATMFALLAFYIASAAFRAFRARSLEATLLLIAAILVMIGRVPLGDAMWEPLGKIADWIMTYPNGAAKRAIMIGVGLGMAATSLKLMLGIERAYLGRGQ